MPRSALVFSDDGRLGVRIVDADNRVQFVPVDFVDDARDVIWLTGLDKATRVIVVGQDFVKDGDVVEAVGRQPTRTPRRCRRHEAHRRFRDRPCAADAGDPRLPAGGRARSPISRIPKEANPDVTIPIIYVQLSQRGISPEDAERLLVRPMETGAQVGHQRQGDARRRLRGRRLCAARVRGRLQLRRRARRTCAPRSTTPSATCPPTPTSRASTRSISASSR